MRNVDEVECIVAEAVFMAITFELAPPFCPARVVFVYVAVAFYMAELCTFPSKSWFSFLLLAVVIDPAC